ncbi:unnamed protein product [Caenorhabditis bovis]|uniref:Uncharacterized protein n=1 Tax=Caenorhabditis bovis TaxID=2654633 RepID=A0A8S1EW93_9PELO|nr:unnamed protein product [Caenorhabditis bovis]
MLSPALLKVSMNRRSSAPVANDDKPTHQNRNRTPSCLQTMNEDQEMHFQKDRIIEGGSATSILVIDHPLETAPVSRRSSFMGPPINTTFEKKIRKNSSVNIS